MPTAVPPPPLPSPALVELLARPRTLAVQANGLRFTYLEWGNPAGPLVLCLHGFPDAPQAFDALGAKLAGLGYRVVAPYTRGYDPTEIPADGDYRPTTLAADALGLMTALGHRKAVVVGHDWGALAAYATAARAPERVSKLVTIAIPHPAAAKADLLGRASHFLAYPLPGAPGRFAADDVAGWDQIVRKWSPGWTPTPGEREQAKRAFRVPGGATAIFGYYRALAAGMAGAALGREPDVRFTQLRMPTLTVYGSEDGALDAGQFEASRRWFTGPFQLVGFPGAGHFPHRERPETFAQVVAAFLK